VGRLSRLTSRARRGQALLGALIAVGAVGLLAASLYSIAVEGSRLQRSATTQVAAMGAAEGALNIAGKVVGATNSQALQQNLMTVPRSTAQAWGTQSTSYQAAQQNFKAMMTGYGPYMWTDSLPYTAQSPPGAAVVGLSGTLPGPGGALSWKAYAGLIAVPSPLPSWTDNGSVATLTFPFGFIMRAWVWGPPGSGAQGSSYLGEMTSYSVSTVPGTITLTYQDCPWYYTPPQCSYPVAVQIVMPEGELVANDANALVPPPP
jgi:hypothetical protein